MASGQWSSVVQQVNRLWTSGTAVGLTESQLLDQFAAGDESAFEALVARHGPMVHGVCRRVLRDTNDADDAFQATFLVLARKAGTLGDREALASWLYGVARRVSARARTDANNRRLREAAADPGRPAQPDAAHQAQRRELAETVQSEVDRLPASSRAVVVLCDLAGCTHEEAAARLGWPLGTVKGRHFRARNQLRDRLIRRGLAPATILSALAAGSEARPVVPRALLETTARAACSYAAGRATLAGLAATHATLLAQGVIKTMLTHQIQWAAAATLTAALLTAGAGVVAQGIGTETKPGDPTKAAPPVSTKSTAATSADAAPQAAETPPTLNQLAERRREADVALQTLMNAAQSGVAVDPKDVRLWLDRMDATTKELDRRFLAGLERDVRQLEEKAVESGADSDKLSLLRARTKLEQHRNKDKVMGIRAKTSEDYEREFIQFGILKPSPLAKQDPKADPDTGTPTTTPEASKSEDPETRLTKARDVLRAMEQVLRANGEVDIDEARLWLKRVEQAILDRDAPAIAKASGRMEELTREAAKSGTADAQVRLLKTKAELARLEKHFDDQENQYHSVKNFVQMNSHLSPAKGSGGAVLGMGGGMAQSLIDSNRQFMAAKDRLTLFRNAALVDVEIPRDQLKDWLDRYEKASEAFATNQIENQTKTWRSSEAYNVEIRKNLRQKGMTGATVPGLDEPEETNQTLAELKLATAIAQVKRQREQDKHAFDDLRGLLETGKYTPQVSEQNAKPAQTSLPGIADGPNKLGVGQKPGVSPSKMTATDQSSLEGGAKELGPIAEIGDDPASKEVSKRLATVISTDFTQPTTLDDFLKDLKARTKADNVKELSVFVDLQAMGRGGMGGRMGPGGLGMGGMVFSPNPDSKFKLDLHDVPASLALKLALRQLGLVYFVRDGLIFITSPALAEGLEATVSGSGIARPRSARGQ